MMDRVEYQQSLNVANLDRAPASTDNPERTTPWEKTAGEISDEGAFESLLDECSARVAPTIQQKRLTLALLAPSEEFDAEHHRFDAAGIGLDRQNTAAPGTIPFRRGTLSRSRPVGGALSTW